MLTSPPSRTWSRYFQEAEATADGGGAYRLAIIGNKITFVCRDSSPLEKLISEIDGWMLEASKRMRDESDAADRHKAEHSASLVDREHRKTELHEKYQGPVSCRRGKGALLCPSGLALGRRTS